MISIPWGTIVDLMYFLLLWIDRKSAQFDMAELVNLTFARGWIHDRKAIDRFC